MSVLSKFLKISCLLLTGLDTVGQLPVAIGNTSNTGNASWGAGTGVYAFHVTGIYDASGNTATDHFYDAGDASGTAIEISGTAAPSFYRLILDNGAAATATISNTAGVDVAGNLQLLNGITITADNPSSAIRLGASADLSGSSAFGVSRHVDGYVGKTGTGSFTFPVGHAGIYSPATFSNPAATTLRYTVGDPGFINIRDNTQGALNLATVSALEYYPVNSAALSGTDVMIPYGNFGPEGYVGDPASLTIAGWDGGKWVNLGSLSNNINTTDETVTVTLNRGLATFSKITLGSTSILNPLPVVLTGFTAYASGCSVSLSWQTSAEINSSHYDIEWGTDAVYLTGNGSVPSKNATTGAMYRYELTDLSGGIYYFRLKMVDLDGTFTYSKTIPVEVNCRGTASITVWPNPADNRIIISGIPDNTQITVMDIAGRVLIKETNFDRSVHEIAVDNLPGGIYFIQFVEKNGRVSLKKIVKRG